MGEYRISRNIEASIVDYLTAELLAGGWSNITVEKSFARIYGLEIGGKNKKIAVCVRCGITTYERTGIGEDSTIRTPQVLIDLFCGSDGQRLDLKDFLIAKLKGGFSYYNYTITGGQVQAKVLAGRIRVLDIEDSPIDFDIDKDKLDIHDRYRSLITLSISLGKVEV